MTRYPIGIRLQRILKQKRPTGLIAQAEEEAKENQQRLASMTAEEQQAAQQEVQKKIDAGAFERKEPRRKVRYVKEDADLGPSITPQEHVLREIATGRVSFSLSDTEGAQGLSSHLGYSNSPEEREKACMGIIFRWFNARSRSRTDPC